MKEKREEMMSKTKFENRVKLLKVFSYYKHSSPTRNIITAQTIEGDEDFSNKKLLNAHIEIEVNISDSLF